MPSGADVPINYRNIVSADLPVNLTDASGAALLPNPSFTRISASSLVSGDTQLYTCPSAATRYCMIVGSTFFKSTAGTLTATFEYKAGGTGSYIPFRNLTVSASGTTQDIGQSFLLSPGDILGGSMSALSTTNLWVTEIEFDQTAALVPVRITSGFSAATTIYTVPAGKTALILGAGFSAPGLSNGLVRYFNNSASSITCTFYIVPSGGSAGTGNQVSLATAVPAANPASFQVNSSLSSGDFLVANVSSTSTSQIIYLTLLVY